MNSAENNIRFLEPKDKWLLDKEAAIKHWILNCVELRGFKIAQVDYSFLTNTEIEALNINLLNHHYPTDIITLDHSNGRRRLRVEMYLGYEFIREYAQEHQIDPKEELCRVLVHGLLHCMGWDDKDIDAKNKMRIEEDKCLLSRPN